MITPKAGRSAIPVYGGAYPEASVYAPDQSPLEEGNFLPLQYSIPAGQLYVAHNYAPSTYYNAGVFTTDRTKNVLRKGNDTFYAISFNHRLAFVRTEDVNVVSTARPQLPFVQYLPTMRAQ